MSKRDVYDDEYVYKKENENLSIIQKIEQEEGEISSSEETENINDM
jgi:hypothetical protein